MAKSLYLLLGVPRTATPAEVKAAYREIALRLHPDRHGGCAAKTAAFKEASEAYRVLSDWGKRREYDRWLSDMDAGGDGKLRPRGASRAAERNPFYRKVYSPVAPPGMKIFDPKRHYDMHYGHGMMNEEIERARRRAEAASPRKNGFSYRSPLGAGFSFDRGRPMDQQMNPYSRKGARQHDHLKEGGFRIQYEEGYMDMSGGDGARRAMRGKEYVVERMHERRKNRVRERGDPPRRRRPREGSVGGDSGNSDSCAIM